jgi:hypothetical protein
VTVAGRGALGVTWTETFRGWLAFGLTDFNQAMLPRHREPVRAQLSLEISDLDHFLAHQADGGVSREPVCPATVSAGAVECEGFSGSLIVTGGTFLALVTAGEREPRDAVHLRMRYDLALRGPTGESFRLEGFKLIENDPGYDSWSDSTTLFVRIFPAGDPAGAPLGAGAPVGAGDPIAVGNPIAVRGPAAGGDPIAVRGPAAGGDPIAVGVLRISPLAFLRELATFRGRGPSPAARLAAVARYQWFFTAGLARAYLGPPVRDSRPSFPQDRVEPVWATTRRGGAVAEADVQFSRVPGTKLGRAIIPFAVPDLEFPLNLHRLRRLDDDGRPRSPTRGPVLLVPGSGVRAEMYYGQPVGPSFAEYLLDRGYDVWVESWRASIDLPPNPYTLDQAAMIDHPRAVDTILGICQPGGGGELRAVAQCQGSISFMMAAVAGRLDARVTQIVSSAVSLFIDVRRSTWLKQRLAMPTVGRLFPWADAQWGIRPVTPAAGLFAAGAKLAQRPCGNPPCQVANFMYGSGWDVLLRHVDDAGDPWVADAVHEWTGRELGYTPMSLIGQIAESSRHGYIVPTTPRPPDTPAAYLASPPQTGAQITFIAGDHNNMFRWQGQRRARDFFDQAAAPGQADFVLLPGFGHLDTFWARRAPQDVFPVILDGLEWKRGDPAPSERPGRHVSGGGWPTRRGRFLGR